MQLSGTGKNQVLGIHQVKTRFQVPDRNFSQFDNQLIFQTTLALCMERFDRKYLI